MILLGRTWKFIEPTNWKTSLLECFMICLPTKPIVSPLLQPAEKCIHLNILHIRMHPERCVPYVHNESWEKNVIKSGQNWHLINLKRTILRYEKLAVQTAHACNAYSAQSQLITVDVLHLLKAENKNRLSLEQQQLVYTVENDCNCSTKCLPLAIKYQEWNHIRNECMPWDSICSIIIGSDRAIRFDHCFIM